jgi:hypothetical protein
MIDSATQHRPPVQLSHAPHARTRIFRRSTLACLANIQDWAERKREEEAVKCLQNDNKPSSSSLIANKRKLDL